MSGERTRTGDERVIICVVVAPLRVVVGCRLKGKDMDGRRREGSMGAHMEELGSIASIAAGINKDYVWA